MDNVEGAGNLTGNKAVRGGVIAVAGSVEEEAEDTENRLILNHICLLK